MFDWWSELSDTDYVAITAIMGIVDSWLGLRRLERRISRLEKIIKHIDDPDKNTDLLQ